jgi:hypothetical protein
MRARDRRKPRSEPVEALRRDEKRFSRRFRLEQPKTGRPMAVSSRRHPCATAGCDVDLAQLQSEIQGGYDTHAVQIGCISFSFGTTLEFRGLIATDLGIRDPCAPQPERSGLC